MKWRDARYKNVADMLIFYQIILANADTDIYFPLFWNDTKSLLCRNYKQSICKFGQFLAKTYLLGVTNFIFNESMPWKYL